MKKLTLIDKAFLLKQTPLFESLDLDILLPIADKLSISTFSKNEQIFRIDEPALRMYLIAEGTIELIDHTGNTINTLSKVDFFGDEALFNDQPRAYGALCKTDSVLLSISRTNLLTIISECPSVAVSLLRLYTSVIPVRRG